VFGVYNPLRTNGLAVAMVRCGVSVSPTVVPYWAKMSLRLSRSPKYGSLSDTTGSMPVDSGEAMSRRGVSVPGPGSGTNVDDTPTPPPTRIGPNASKCRRPNRWPSSWAAIV
jgi:hypothetical protein